MCHPEHYRLLQMIIILHAHWEGGTLVPVTLDYLGILRSSLFRMFQEQREKEKAYEASLIASKLLAVLEMIAKLTGELRGSGITINNTQLNGAPVPMGDLEVAKVQALIIRALRPFPDARAAVIEILEDDHLSATDGLPHKSPFPERPLLAIERELANG